MGRLLEGTILVLLAICVRVQPQETTPYCPPEATDAVMGMGYQCIQDLMRLAGNFPYSLFYTSFWSTYCSGQYELGSCVMEVFKSCPDNYILRMTRHAREYVWQEFNDIGFYPTRGSCNGTGGIRLNVTKLYEVPGLLCQEAVFNSLSVCVEEWMDGITYIVTDTGAMKRTSANNSDSLALDMYRCGIGSITPSCNNRPTRALAKFLMDQTVPALLRTKLQNEDFRNNLLPYQVLSTRRVTVGAFGDPHVLAYHLPDLLTCEVHGNHAYLTNTFFAINATATHVGEETLRASALTTVVVWFFDKDGRGVQSYSSSSGTLSSTLSNGATSGTAGGSQVMVSSVSDSRVVLRLDDLAVVIEIGSWNNYFSVGVRMSEDLYGKSYGLLVQGCPRADRITRLGSGQESEPGACVDACSSINNTDTHDYRSTCEYDCRIMGITKVAPMTQMFVDTVTSLSESDSNYALVEPLRALNNSPPTSLLTAATALITLLLALLL